MPKVRSVQSPSIDCTRSHPYPSNSKNDELHKPMNLLGSADDMKEWEDARCPICLEPPHNAVLLKCSSHEMGCRPFMCNTSYRHSNCLDQFCKSFASHLSSTILQEIPLTSTTSRSRDVQPEPGRSSQHGIQLQPNLVCPLCRGGIYGYMVLEPARRYMNSKPRSCSSETCEFQGTYPELRKHARSEHPSVRPSEVDPSRQCDWLRMEQEMDMEDLFSTIRPSSEVEYQSDAILSGGLADFMSYFLYEIFSSIEDTSQMTSLLSGSRDRVHLISDDVQTNQPARWRSNLPSAHQLGRSGRGRWRTNLSSRRSLEAQRTARWRTNSSSSRTAWWRTNSSSSRTARWRTNLSSSRMPREDHQYYRELIPGVRTSSMMSPPPPWTSSSMMSPPPSWTSSSMMSPPPPWSSSSMMSPPPPSQVTQTSPWWNTSSSPSWNTSSSGTNSGNSSSGRVPGTHLRWRNQRWTTYDTNDRQ